MNIIPEVTIKHGSPEDPVSSPPGTPVKLDDKEALRLITVGLAKKDEQIVAQEEAKGTELIEAIMDAIADLEPQDFGKDEKPSVKALENVLGQGITAADRDKAWAEYQKLVKPDGQ